VDLVSSVLHSVFFFGFLNLLEKMLRSVSIWGKIMVYGCGLRGIVSF